MKNTSQTTSFLKSGFWIAILVLIPLSQLTAGVILTKTKQAKVGNVIENGNVITFQSQYGAVDYPKDSLAWYSLDKEVDTILKGAQKAAAADDLANALSLFEISANEEPATKESALAQLAEVRNGYLNKITPRPEETAPVAKSSGKSGGSKIASLSGSKKGKGKKGGFARLGEDPRITQPTEAAPSGPVTAGTPTPAQAAPTATAAAPASGAPATPAPEVDKELEQAKKDFEAATKPVEWTFEEKMAHYAVLGVFGLIGLGSFWRITLAEKDDK